MSHYLMIALPEIDVSLLCAEVGHLWLAFLLLLLFELNEFEFDFDFDFDFDFEFEFEFDFDIEFECCIFVSISCVLLSNEFKNKIINKK
jgi:hypothetical protein